MAEHEHPSRIVADWIEEMQRAGNADALRWMIGRAAFAFLTLYPEDRGPQVLWGIFRGLAGAEREQREVEGCS